MKRQKLLIAGLSIFLLAQSSFAQNDGQGRSQSDIEARERQAEQRQKETLYQIGGLNKSGMIPGRDMTPAGVPLSNTSAVELRAKMRAAVTASEMVKVPRAYRENFKSLLKGADAELARLFMDRNCDLKEAVSVEDYQRCAALPPVDGNGSLYSFNWERNIFVRGTAKDKLFPDERFTLDISDLHYKEENRFAVGSYTVLGIISDLGKVDLESVDLSSPAVKFLADYKPQIKSSDVEREQNIIRKGVNSGGFLYSAAAPAVVDHTYILRSISYRPKKSFPFMKRDDLIIAFKLLGREPNDSVVIAWKMLKKDKSPVMEN